MGAVTNRTVAAAVASGRRRRRERGTSLGNGGIQMEIEFPRQPGIQMVAPSIFLMCGLDFRVLE